MKVAECFRNLGRKLSSERSRAFYNGRLCPIIIIAIMFLGNVSSLELYTNLLLVLFVAAGLVFARTERPLIAFGCAFLFQIPAEHSPGYQSDFSSYYFGGYRLVILVVSAVLLFGSMLFCFVAKKNYAKFSLKTPMLLPLAVLCFSFMFNGAFSDGWKWQGFAYGVLQALIYAGLFLYFYLAFRDEDGRELLSYFTFVSVLIAFLLFAIVGYTFIRAYLLDGSVAKEDMTFGFGTWNTAGVCLTVLIPTCFVGVIGKGNTILSLAGAVAAYCGAMLTISRNAQLFGTVAFCLCLAVCCFAGKYKKVFRIIVSVGVFAVIVGGVCLSILFADKLSGAVTGFLDSNGRFELWQTGIDNFRSSPVFGVGFYSFFPGESIDEASHFFPAMAHQTVVEILSSMGIFGLLGYIFYRVGTVIPFLRRISAEKILLLLSVFTLLGESMLDNFIFYFLPVIYYSFTLVIVQIISDGERDSERTEKNPSPEESEASANLSARN